MLGQQFEDGMNLQEIDDDFYKCNGLLRYQTQIFPVFMLQKLLVTKLKWRDILKQRPTSSVKDQSFQQQGLSLTFFPNHQNDENHIEPLNDHPLRQEKHLMQKYFELYDKCVNKI